MEEKKEKIRKKRIVIEVDSQLHCELKAMAAYKGISLRKYSLRGILMQIDTDKEYL